MTSHPQRLVSLWDMLRKYGPIYQIGLELEERRHVAELYSGARSTVDNVHAKQFKATVQVIRDRCAEHGLTFTSEMADRILNSSSSPSYDGMFADLNHLDGSLLAELGKEAAFRVPPDRSSYYERDDLFGGKVAAAFPACERDIQEAGSCYALGRADACVHHLMMVLERGLHALAGKVGVAYQRENWQKIIDGIETKLKGMPRGPELDFYREVKAQFGFLKDAYRNHSEHAHEVPYDIPGALSILNHVRSFMQALEKGGLSE